MYFGSGERWGSFVSSSTFISESRKKLSNKTQSNTSETTCNQKSWILIIDFVIEIGICYVNSHYWLTRSQSSTKFRWVHCTSRRAWPTTGRRRRAGWSDRPPSHWTCTCPLRIPRIPSCRSGLQPFCPKKTPMISYWTRRRHSEREFNKAWLQAHVHHVNDQINEERAAEHIEHRGRTRIRVAIKKNIERVV